MWRASITWVLVACVDHTVAERPPCQGRLYGYDVGVEIDRDGRGCIAWPAECRGRRLDADPNTVGMQYSCTVSDVRHYGLADQSEEVMVECDANATTVPCWRVVADATCAGADPVALEVIRAVPPPEDSMVIAYCFACLADWYNGSY